jgi:flagellin-like hook-associated protein FlgL
LSAALTTSGLGEIGTTGAIELEATNTTESITVGGTAAAGVGLAASYAPTNDTIGALTGSLSITVGSGSAQTINFGAGNVQTRAQLTTALAGITETVTIAGTGTGATGLLAGTNIGVNTPTTTVGTPSTTRQNLQTQYNELLTQIDALARDASYNGINLLNGDNLKVVFNEDGSSSQTVTGVTFTATGLGLTNLAGSEFQTNATVDTVVADIDGALNELRTQASKFGSNLTTVQTRQEFTKNLINTLQTGADNLVLADTNEEGANLLALQTRQQLSTTALSLSAQADQAVLRLF